MKKNKRLLTQRTYKVLPPPFIAAFSDKLIKENEYKELLLYFVYSPSTSSLPKQNETNEQKKQNKPPPPPIPTNLIRRKCFHEMALESWVLIYSFILILLKKIAGGHNLQTVFFCWRHNMHQNPVSFTAWTPKQKCFMCPGEKQEISSVWSKKSWTPRYYYLWPNS